MKWREKGYDINEFDWINILKSHLKLLFNLNSKECNIKNCIEQFRLIVIVLSYFIIFKSNTYSEWTHRIPSKSLTKSGADPGFLYIGKPQNGCLTLSRFSLFRLWFFFSLYNTRGFNILMFNYKCLMCILFLVNFLM